MTARESEIAIAILGALHATGGKQLAEPVLHATANFKLASFATLAEFDGALKAIEAERWVAGTRGQLKGLLWRITDLGESIYAENR